MYFSRITLRPDVESCSDIQTVASAGEYRLHQLAWSFFDSDPNANRDFLFRHDITGGERLFYIVSRRKPVDRKGIWRIATREYDPIIARGASLAFSLRCNPTRDRSNPNGKRERHDVVMDAKKRNDADPVTTAMRDWLEKRGARCGFSLAGLTSATYHRRSFPGRGGRAITLGVVDVVGFLKVTDATAFRQTLFDGMGRGRGFGMGLLLVRRA